METALDTFGNGSEVVLDHQEIVTRAIQVLGIDMQSLETLAAQLPFSSADTTCGLENEFQAVVMGEKDRVDLPMVISRSACFRNAGRSRSGQDSMSHHCQAFERYLNNNETRVWENSWVRFDRDRLNLHGYQVLDSDLRKDKSNPFSGYREDRHQFLFNENGCDRIRVPVSYLMKLALADAAGTPGTHHRIRSTAKIMMESYVSDNSSPEVLSFYPSSMTRSGWQHLKPVRETAARFLFTQLLVAYGNKKFGLEESGQTAMVYFSSHTPQRLKQFNYGIPDALYRELFMSPCLSGWDRGEDKFAYMHQCHRVLSRSRMNGILKLKDAGIVTSNLILLPNISDASLANNGTHVSLGSRKLTRLLIDPASGFTSRDEKYLGDLVIKIAEHFLPLFVGTYSAAPFRLDFQDFHPEKVLGFLPHELAPRHLRHLWRLWKKKAGLKILNRPITPFGPEKVDRFISRLFFLKGDLVTDFRLLDYFAALPCTEENSPLNGRLDNEKLLAADLQEMGMFDKRMPMYMLMRMRKASVHGFSGFEGRYYSTFDSLLTDLGQAIQIQQLILCLAYKLIFQFKVTHDHIPDAPLAESQRRQIFFGSAMGLDHIILEKDASYRFLDDIVSTIPSLRKVLLSWKSGASVKVSIRDYRMALVKFLEDQAGDIVLESGMQSVLKDLMLRIAHPGHRGVLGKMTRAVLGQTGRKTPFSLSAESFNLAMESHYRNDLRKKHMAEGFEVLMDNCQRLDLWAGFRDPDSGEALAGILTKGSAQEFLVEHKDGILDETAAVPVLEKAIQLMILSTSMEMSNG
ncbi:MAG: hypothetical protein V1793_19190 [Pseudomonadota bacterium]